MALMWRRGCISTKMTHQDKCDKCNKEGTYGHITKRHYLCRKCFYEWYDNGYWDIWHTFYRAGSYELADKFALDYLGKLG